jgi:hypothetical protein
MIRESYSMYPKIGREAEVFVGALLVGALK